ncbi:MAG: methylamine utilization protein [Gammaproteobacteria bacterium]
MIEAIPDRRAAGRGRLRAMTLAMLPLLSSGLAAPAPCIAENLVATVRNEQGEPVQNAVVYAWPLNAEGNRLWRPDRIEIDQINKEFVPYVTAIPVGSNVSFPNRDQIRHHVYSFSTAKTFEIPLYKGTPAESVHFNQPGEVVLGCNIHDWMKAYVFVSETPYFGVTDRDGLARIDLPAGDYRVEVWHPELKGGSELTAVRHRIATREDSELSFSIEQKRVWTPRRAPSISDPGYR